MIACSTTAAGPAREVAVLEKSPATFVMRTDQLIIARIGEDSDAFTKRNLGPPGHINPGDVATRANHHDALLVSGRNVYRVGVSGDVEKWRTIEPQELRRATGTTDGAFSWFAQWHSATSSFFTAFLSHDEAGRKYVCGIAEAYMGCIDVEFPTPESTVIGKERIYTLSTRSPAVNVLKLNDGAHHQIELDANHSFFSVALDSQAEHLLISDLPSENEPPILLVDLESGEQTVLPIKGSLAAWVNDESIVFVGMDNELLLYDLDDQEVSKLLRLGTSCADDGSIYTSRPDPSPSGRFVAWRWCTRDGEQEIRGTALLDLERREYQLVSVHWYTGGWVELEEETE